MEVGEAEAGEALMEDSANNEEDRQDSARDRFVQPVKAVDNETLSEEADVGEADGEAQPEVRLVYSCGGEESDEIFCDARSKIR